MIDQCKHKWVLLEIRQAKESVGYRNHEYRRTDEFFCEKCLDRREVKRNLTADQKPEWYSQ